MALDSEQVRAIAKDEASSEIDHFSWTVLGWDRKTVAPGKLSPADLLSWGREQHARQQRIIKWRGAVLTFLVGSVAAPGIWELMKWLSHRLTF